MPGAGVPVLGHRDRLTPRVQSPLVSLHPRTSHILGVLTPDPDHLCGHSPRIHHVTFTATAPMCSPTSHPTPVRAEPWRAGRRIRSYLSSLRVSRLYGLGSCGIRKNNSFVII